MHPLHFDVTNHSEHQTGHGLGHVTTPASPLHVVITSVIFVVRSQDQWMYSVSLEAAMYMSL